LLRDNALVLAEDQLAVGHPAEARALVEDLLRGKYGALPLIPKLETLVKFATIEDVTDKKPDALRHWAQAHATAVELLTRYKKELPLSDQIRCSRYLILCNEALGHVELATQELESLEKLHGQQRDNGFQKRQTQIQLASQCVLRKDYPRAELYLKRALNDPQAAEDRLARAHLFGLLASIYEDQAKPVEAVENWKQSAALYETLLAAAGPLDLALRAGTLRQLRTIYQHMDRPQDARRAAEQLYGLRKQEFGEKHPLTVEAKTVLEKLFETSAQ
jgi:tetratricopeptide (TPR) repeat protein